jgi:hypothetical protein
MNWSSVTYVSKMDSEAANRMRLADYVRATNRYRARMTDKLIGFENVKAKFGEQAGWTANWRKTGILYSK